MFHFFKRKKIVVDAFTYVPAVYELAAPKPAKKFIPENFKKLKSSYNENAGNGINFEFSTIKRCIGIQQIYNSGFVIPSWTDFTIKVDQHGRYVWSSLSNIMSVVHHSNQQVWSDFMPEWTHLKIETPWVFSEKTGVNMVWTNAEWFWKQLPNVKILNGVVDYKYQSTTSLNIMMKNSSSLDVKFGDPLVHIIPISEYDVEINPVLLTKPEYDMKSSYQVTSRGNYHFVKKARQAKEQERKCPFGFGK
jgi:hypothetical protein